MKRLYVSDLEIVDGTRDARDRPDNPNRTDRPRTREQLTKLAVEELRESDFSLHDHRTLQAIRDRLTDADERYLMERVLVVCEPRKRP